MGTPDVKAPGPIAADQAQGQSENLPSDCADVPTAVQGIRRYGRKRQAKLQAVAALQGVALHRLADGSWLASRWNLSRELADTAVEAWLRQIGCAV